MRENGHVEPVPPPGGPPAAQKRTAQIDHSQRAPKTARFGWSSSPRLGVHVATQADVRFGLHVIVPPQPRAHDCFRGSRPPLGNLRFGDAGVVQRLSESADRGVDRRQSDSWPGRTSAASRRSNRAHRVGERGQGCVVVQERARGARAVVVLAPDDVRRLRVGDGRLSLPDTRLLWGDRALCRDRGSFILSV
jgi:hypothetical protein